MATPAQIAANQANARLSTGPRTPEGKAAVSRNAVKHGFASTHEDRGTFEEFSEEFRKELKPATPLEDELCEQIIHAAWNLRRIRIAERALLDDTQWDLDRINKLTRYRRAMQRDFDRALAELEARQAERAVREELEKPALTSLDLARQTPPLASVPKLAKQTQSLRKSYEENDLEAAQEELAHVLAAAAGR
jgi:hypothetical protein